MKIIKLPKVNGITYNLLDGTSRFAYGTSDVEEFYELENWQEAGGYQGSVLYLYDLKDNRLYQPFEKRINVTYGEPLFSDGYIYILQGDYDNKEINLYKFMFECDLEKIKTFNMEEVNLYNLRLIGEGVNLISQDSEIFASYYPEKFEIDLKPNENVVMIDENLIYISAWIEEGIVNHFITQDYKFYDKLIIKDKAGKLISEEVGSLNKYPDGRWRLS